MTKLLVQGEVILAKDVVDAGDEFHTADQIIPKHVVPGWQIVDVEVPEGFTCAGYAFDGAGVVKKPEVVPPKTREELKAEREKAVAAITVTVGDKVFDGDETSQERMSRALRVADITGQTSCIWVLHNNEAVIVTKDELAQALALSLQAQAAIWVLP